MYYPQLDYIKETHPQTAFDIDETMLLAVLGQSHGKPTMSDEDVKMAILSLLCISKTQQKLIDELIDCVNDLRTPKKKFWQRRK